MDTTQRPRKFRAYASCRVEGAIGLPSTVTLEFWSRATDGKDLEEQARKVFYVSGYEHVGVVSYCILEH